MSHVSIARVIAATGGLDAAIKALPEGWFTFVAADGVDCAKPGIYEWRIEGGDVYIGKYTSISRPKRAYGNNVLRLLREQPYRPSDPDGFRLIHKALAKAIMEKRRVTLTILENCPKDDLLRREAWLISQRGTLNGTHRSGRSTQLD